MSPLHKLPSEIISHLIVPHLLFSDLFRLARVFPRLNLIDACNIISERNHIPFPPDCSFVLLLHSHFHIKLFDDVISDIIYHRPIRKLILSFQITSSHSYISNSILLIKIIKAFSSSHSDPIHRANIYLIDYCSQLFYLRNPNIHDCVFKDFKKFILSYHSSWQFAEVDFFHLYENANLISSDKRSFAFFDNIIHMSSFHIIDSFHNSVETIKSLAFLTKIFTNHKIRAYLIFHIYSYINLLFLLPTKSLLHHTKFIHVASLKISQFQNDIQNRVSFKFKKIILHQLELFERNYNAFISL